MTDKYWLISMGAYPHKRRGTRDRPGRAAGGTRTRPSRVARRVRSQTARVSSCVVIHRLWARRCSRHRSSRTERCCSSERWKLLYADVSGWTSFAERLPCSHGALTREWRSVDALEEQCLIGRANWYAIND